MEQFTFFPLIPLVRHSNVIYMSYKTLNAIQTNWEKRFSDLAVQTHSNQLERRFGQPLEHRFLAFGTKSRNASHMEMNA